MNAPDSSKISDIHSEGELIRYFSRLLGEDPDLKWKVPPGAHAQGRLPWVELRLDDHSHRFKPVYLLKPSVPELESLVAGWDQPAQPLLVVPELSPRALDVCRKRQLGAIDLNGRAFVRAAGLLVDRCALPGRAFRFQLEPRNVFVGKSVRIIRTLLTDRDRAWGQGELVRRAQASPGLVSRIVQHLVRQGFVEKQSAREFRLSDPLGLLDAWAKADNFTRRATTSRYTLLAANPLKVAQEINTWAQKKEVPIAFTQWLAAWLRQPYTEPVIASAYVARLPEPATLERLGLRPVGDAGKIWLHVPDDEGLFLETQVVQHLPLASDAQIFVDLQQTGLRGPDQAVALRNWEGFCRP